MDHDAIVIGGSFAGLAAATYIARARRTVAIADTGKPRNRVAAHSHGFLGHDGSAPGAILDTARAQVAAYPTASFFTGADGEVVRASQAPGGFAIETAAGRVLTARRLVLAFGVTDELPAIPGLAERWGRAVLHCPYCHGYEVGGQRLGVLHVTPMSVHQAMLIREWGPTTYFLNGATDIDDDALKEVRARGVDIEPAPVMALRGEGTGLSAVQLRDGREVPLDALFIGPRNRFTTDLAVQLGCELGDSPLGRVIRTDGQMMTTVPGVFAAGDITRGMHSVTLAAADGMTAGVALHRSLVF